MQKEEDKTVQKVPQILTSLGKVMSGINPVGKNQKNEQQNYQYRGVDDVFNALHDLFVENNIIVRTELIEESREERKTNSGGNLVFTKSNFFFYLTSTIDGSEFRQGPIPGEGMDTGDKSSNKAMSVAAKYALVLLFVIPTKDPKDPETEGHEVAPKTDNSKSGFKPWANKPKTIPTSGKTYKKIDEILMNGVLYQKMQLYKDATQQEETGMAWWPPYGSNLAKYKSDEEFNRAYEQSQEANTVNPDDVPV